MECQEGRAGTVECAAHAGSCWQRGGDRSAQADADGDGRGSPRGIVASEHFKVSGGGHRALEAWARQFGPIARWGVENAAGWGRHTAIFLIGRGFDVRDVCANRTPRHDRARQRGKSDTLDSERIARETLAHPLLPKAFKRAGQDQGPDELHQLLVLWHNRRRSILTSRQHLVNEAEHLLCELPLELREQLPGSRAVRRRLAALQRRNRRRRYDRPTRLRLEMLDRYQAQIGAGRRGEAVAATCRSSCVRAARRWASSVACRPGRSPSSWSRPAMSAASPRAAFAASTPPPRCPLRRRRDLASRCGTGTTPVATGGSTPSFTGWPSPSWATSRAPRRSTPTRAPTDTPRRRLAASSNDTSQTSSTDA